MVKQALKYFDNGTMFHIRSGMHSFETGLSCNWKKINQVPNVRSPESTPHKLGSLKEMKSTLATSHCYLHLSQQNGGFRSTIHCYLHLNQQNGGFRSTSHCYIHLGRQNGGVVDGASIDTNRSQTTTKTAQTVPGLRPISGRTVRNWLREHMAPMSSDTPSFCIHITAC